MNSSIEPLLDEILLSVEGSAASFNYDLCGFAGMAGDACSGGLMIVGRAVNSWQSGWKAESLSDPSIRESILRNTVAASKEATICPMRWVLERWQATSDYNTARSAFWRCAKEVLRELDVSHSPDQWSSSIYWTNLYKVSPYAGGNPANKLCEAQLQACRSLLKYEMEQAGSPRILFMTGLDWAFPFLPTLDSATFSENYQSLVPLRGIAKFATSPVSVVVARHPQGKDQYLWVNQVAHAFRELEDLKSQSVVGEPV